MEKILLLTAADFRGDYRATRQDALAGAIGGATAEALSRFNNQLDQLTGNKAASELTTAGASIIANHLLNKNPDTTYLTAATQALQTDRNNRQLHPDMVKAAQAKAKELAGKEGLTAEQWEKRLTQQLLYQNDSGYKSFGNDVAAEAILKDLAKTSGLDLDARGTPAYTNHAMNSQYLGQLASSYGLAGNPGNMNIEPLVRAMSQAANDPNMVKQTAQQRKQLFDDMLAVASELPPESLTSSQTTDSSQSALFTALNRVGNSLLGTGVLTMQQEESVRQRQLQALVMGYGNALAAAGLGTRSLQSVKALAAGADIATVTRVESLAQEAIAANAKLSRSTKVADGPYEAPVHTSTNAFQTHGVTLEQVPTGILNQLTKDLSSGAGVGKLEEIVQSGKTIPIPSLATSETKLYRIQVEVYKFNSESVYYMDAAQLQRVQSNPQLLHDLLGLPPNSQGSAYTIYERQPLAGQTPTIYQSNIATVTTDSGGKSVGAGIQTILPNAKLWSAPKAVGTIQIKG